MDDDAGSSLPLRGGYSRSNKSVLFWWILNITLVVFAFLAFLFAALSYSSGRQLSGSVSNNFYAQQGGLIDARYPVSKSAPPILPGQVLSFCDDVNSVCTGLGPRWSNKTLYPAGTLTPAVLASLVQLSPVMAAYVWVSSSATYILRVTSILTSTAFPDYNSVPVTQTLTDPVTWLSAKAYSGTEFVIAYTTHNTSYLQVGTVGTGSLQLGVPLTLFTVPTTISGYVVDLAVVGQWIIVTYGPNNENAKYLAYTLSGSTLVAVPLAMVFGFQITNEVSTIYLGNVGGTDYVLQVTGDKALLGKLDYAGRNLVYMQTLTFTNVLYESVGATLLFNGYISLAGVQISGVDVPLTISLILQWSPQQPYLTSNYPSNLLETQAHQLTNFQLSSCYIPSSNNEPQGELFFAYVDAESNRAKIIRAKVTTIYNELQLLSSPPIDISTFNYNQFGSGVSPLVSCPSAVGGVLVAYQYLGTYINSFIWEGGYRFAGIAQESHPGNGKSDILVLRQGVSAVHDQLQPGFSYYLSNSGNLHPHTSLVELFSPTSFATRVGVAISDKQLLLDPYVFEFITRGE